MANKRPALLRQNLGSLSSESLQGLRLQPKLAAELVMCQSFPLGASAEGMKRHEEQLKLGTVWQGQSHSEEVERRAEAFGEV